MTYRKWSDWLEVNEEGDVRPRRTPQTEREAEQLTEHYALRRSVELAEPPKR